MKSTLRHHLLAKEKEKQNKAENEKQVILCRIVIALWGEKPLTCINANLLLFNLLCIIK